MKNKQQLAIVSGIIILLVSVGAIAVWVASKRQVTTPNEPAPKKKLVGIPDNQILVSQRPYVRIIPQPNGKNLELVIETVPLAADAVEYELEYQAGSLLQGAFGSQNLASLPTTTSILLGSCSAGGACTYHEDVKGGTLRLIFNNDSPYAVKGDWNYTINSKKDTDFSSRDAKFQLSSPDLAKSSYVVVYQTPGYPSNLPATPVSAPYSLEWSGPTTGTGTLSIRADQEDNLTIYGWNGNDWQAFATTSEGKTATAEVTLLPLYIVTGGS